MDASGTHLGTIVTGVAHTTNIAWGGADWKTLYMTNLASSPNFSRFVGA
jgi:hypothetical protein